LDSLGCSRNTKAGSKEPAFLFLAIWDRQAPAWQRREAAKAVE
jgi:hypothetical protein